MASRIITNEYQRGMLLKRIEAQKLPFTAHIEPGRNRSVEQNKLQRMWVNEVAEQMGDRTPEEVRGYCKLHFGVPIMRAESEKFCEVYDRLIRPLDYAAKLEFMMVPMDLPVTRIMSTKQKTAYLDAVYAHFSEQGVVLTLPADKRYNMEQAA